MQKIVLTQAIYPKVFPEPSAKETPENHLSDEGRWEIHGRMSFPVIRRLIKKEDLKVVPDNFKESRVFSNNTKSWVYV